MKNTIYNEINFWILNRVWSKAYPNDMIWTTLYNENILDTCLRRRLVDVRWFKWRCSSTGALRVTYKRYIGLWYDESMESIEKRHRFKKVERLYFVRQHLVSKAVKMKFVRHLRACCAANHHPKYYSSWVINSTKQCIAIQTKTSKTRQ